MAAPTAEQIMDILIDIGDPDAATFSDADVTRYWDRVSNAADDTQRHEAVLALMFRTLLSNATKFRDYTAGETQEKMSQIYKQLKEQYDMYYPQLKAAQGQKKQFARGLVQNIPRQGRDYPSGYVYDPDVDDPSL